MRKNCWKELLDEHDEFSSQFEEKIKTSYEYTMNKIMEEKQKRLTKWKKRADYESMIRSISFDPQYEPQNYTPDVYIKEHDTGI